MLIEARQQQVHNKEHFLAVQAQRDREEFNRVLRYIFAVCSTNIKCSQWEKNNSLFCNTYKYSPCDNGMIHLHLQSTGRSDETRKD